MGRGGGDWLVRLAIMVVVLGIALLAMVANGQPTTSTTLPCRVKGASCVVNGVKCPDICCPQADGGRRCGGAKKCR